MTSPEVTIIVPIYNGQTYLRETLDSLLSQSFEDFELLAIDDGSTDASRDIVLSLKDDRVRLITKKNSGLCQTLNHGIAEANGQYIARNDQDDVSIPERLARQCKVMRDYPEAMGLFAYYIKVGVKHRWSNADKLTMSAGQVTEYEPVRDGCLLGSTMFARTIALRSIGGFRESYYPVDDWDLEFRLAERGRVLVLREPLVSYRFHTGANTYRVFSDMQEKSRWALDSHRQRLQSLPERTFDEFRFAESRDRWSRLNSYRLDLAKLHMRTAGQRFLDGRYLASSGHLARAFILDPGDLIGRASRYCGLTPT